jgi:hypothetical protein
MSSAHGYEEIAKQILRYFLRNPQAADNLEGVARWRLLEENVHQTIVETRSALEQLVTEGYLQVVSVPGSELIYVLNTTRHKEAEEFAGAAVDDNPGE